MRESLLATFHAVIESISPSPETLAKRETLAAQQACCALLMEVAQLDSSGIGPKREAVAQAMWEQFAIPDEDLAPMIEIAGRQENRLTSYYRPIALLNRRYTPERKVRLVEQLWRVAMADGDIDIYEEHLVRKFADLLYVPHTDFILAKHRVQEAVKP